MEKKYKLVIYIEISVNKSIKPNIAGPEINIHDIRSTNSFLG